MRALILADIDSIRWEGGSGEVDLILALGDLSDCVILEAWEAFGAPPCFAVRGNHDIAGDFPEGISDLHMRTVEFLGLKFGGFCGSWRYKPKGFHMFDQDEATDLLKTLPATDVLICHNSPRGIHDKLDDIHTGFDALNCYIEKHKPKLLLHGHQHANRETVIGSTRVIGVYGQKVLEL